MSSDTASFDGGEAVASCDTGRAALELDLDVTVLDAAAHVEDEEAHDQLSVIEPHRDGDLDFDDPVALSVDSDTTVVVVVERESLQEALAE